MKKVDLNRRREYTNIVFIHILKEGKQRNAEISVAILLTNKM
ncbi:hypothetical protein FORC48_0865 [Bacillus cereus]|nr:hypothetical protein FORC48_0865 [Bacillus cereus]